MTLETMLASGKPGAAALAGPARRPMTYERLREEVEAFAERLRTFGIRSGDAVALSLPNGPETVVAVLGVCRAAAVAPLNPAYRAAELSFSLADLHARALIVQAGAGGAALEAARAIGLPVFMLTARPNDVAGACSLSRAAGVAVRSRSGEPEFPADSALLLHTSGTTSRPKLVRLTHRNLACSARNITRTLGLEPGDICLDVMPLFHVHGLIGGVLSSLAAGASVWCAPRFDGLRVFTWLEESAATWLTAVPTMHQAILGRAKGHAEVIARHRLRFLRSSSAPLADAIWDQLENVFGTPVLNAYGMTEAAHQIASNPLPPGARRRGTVGIATGPEITIMDAGGKLLGPGAAGEVVLRGETIAASYAHPPEANRTSFHNGWFRTGDEGMLEADGYLSLTGRLKEMINCGGEKISPYEVEAVLLRHPAVAQAVCFAVPHPKLGEEVGAAVVLQPAADASAAALRRTAEEHLARFKVPRAILIVDQIPAGPTGKLQRLGLAARLGLA